MAQYISYALLIVAVFTAYMAIVGIFRSKKLDQRLAKKMAAAKEFRIDDDIDTSFAAVLGKALQACGINVVHQRQAAGDLARAGITGPAAVVYFVFFKLIAQPIFCVIGAVILLKTFILADHSPRLMDELFPLVCGGVCLVLGVFGSKLYLSNTAQHRLEVLAASFPEALDLMLICVESGLGIDAAFGRVCREIKSTHPIIASEFERTRFEMSMMNDRVQALQNLADRTDYVPVRSFVASLVQAERFGTSLVDTIRLIAEEQRNERMLNAEKKAARLPAVITVPLIFFILPSLGIIILGPVMLKISAQGGIFGGG